MKPFLPYGRQLLDDADVEATTQQLRSEWLTQGPTVARFEAALSEYVGARYVVAVSSGTAALHLACLAVGVRPGTYGITATNTFVASANAVRYAGGRVRFTDVDPSTGMIDLLSLERRIREVQREGAPIKAIIPVDFTGAVPDLARVATLAAAANAHVIEDAAHSLGSTYRIDGHEHRAASCAHAAAAILSFHPVKHVTTGEGGAVCTNDEALYRELLELRTHGITKDPERMERCDGPWYYEQRTLGFNYRLTDLQCALGLSQLAKLAAFVQRRRALAQRYDQALAAEPFAGWIAPLRVPENVSSSYHLYVVRLTAREGETNDHVAKRRLTLFEALRARNLGVQVHYIPVHLQPDFVRNGQTESDLTGSARYYASCISLPMFPGMSEIDVDRVVDALAEARASS